MTEQEETIRSYDRDGNAHDDVLRTKSGKIVTRSDIEKWAAEAEEGYEFHEFEQETGAQTYKPSTGPLCRHCGRPEGVHKTAVPRSK